MKKSKMRAAARQNAKRARRAFLTLAYYKKHQLREGGNMDDDTLIDLLTDLRHLSAGTENLNNAIEWSAAHFTEESLAAQPPPPPRVPSKSAVTTTRLLNPPK